MAKEAQDTDFVEVEIVQWFKHQTRKDIKHPTWFAMSNRILEDVKLFKLSDSEWKCLLYIFTQASQQNSNLVKIYYEHAKRVCGLQKSVVDSTISRLCYADVTRTSRDLIRDNTIQDNTNNTNTVCRVVKELPPLPTKSSELLSLLTKEVQSLYDPDFVSREAVKAWAWCQANGAKVPKSVKGWKRFFGAWLERGWDNYRKSLPSSKSLASGVDVSRYKNPEDGGVL